MAFFRSDQSEEKTCLSARKRLDFGDDDDEMPLVMSRFLTHISSCCCSPAVQLISRVLSSFCVLFVARYLLQEKTSKNKKTLFLEIIML